MLGNGLIEVFDSIPAGSENGGTFTAATFDAWSSLGFGVSYAFAEFATSAMDADLSSLQVWGSDDNFSTHVVLADFTPYVQAHGTTQVQRFRAGISLRAGAGRRYLKWHAVAGSGSVGVTGYGIFVLTDLQRGPATVTELNVTNGAYIEVL